MQHTPVFCVTRSILLSPFNIVTTFLAFLCVYKRLVPYKVRIRRSLAIHRSESAILARVVEEAVNPLARNSQTPIFKIS